MVMQMLTTRQPNALFMSSRATYLLMPPMVCAEGGHSHRRIVHAADLTGREVERALLAAARDNPNITFFEHHLGVDLVIGEANGVPHCFGVDVLDQSANTMIRCIAPVTMLATGGGGQV